MQLHAEEAVSTHINLLTRIFIRKKTIKRPFVGISDKETQRILTPSTNHQNWYYSGKSADMMRVIKSLAWLK
jgi:penicillin-binding protein 1A